MAIKRRKINTNARSTWPLFEPNDEETETERWNLTSEEDNQMDISFSTLTNKI